MKHLAAIGFGYTAAALAKQLEPTEWHVTGTSRSEAGAEAIRRQGYSALVLDAAKPAAALLPALDQVTHLLLSAAPDADGDPIIARLGAVQTQLPRLQWIGYLSTVGVYGNHNGAWIDEEAPANPVSERGLRRLVAEKAWQAFGAEHEIVVQTFRLPGIYGPGRSAFNRLRAGSARRINKPGQVFNRMHVDDIAGALKCALTAAAQAGQVFNIVDDEPAPPQDVIAYAAHLLGVEPPPEVDFEAADMTAMARSFYGDNKRVSNARMKRELKYVPRYPSYREGLAAILAQPERNV